MALAMRAFDWEATPLGSPAAWPGSLKMALHILLTSRFAMWVAWGPDALLFFNDAYRPTLGDKAPTALGAPIQTVWPEVWQQVGGRIDEVYRHGRATWDRALLLLLNRSGYLEETYYTSSFSPLLGDSGAVEGLFCAVTDETERVVNERRLAAVSALALALAESRHCRAVLDAAAASLATAPRDLPFALIYLFDAHGTAALAASSGIASGHPMAPQEISPGAGEPAGPADAWGAHRLLAGDAYATLALEPGAAEPLPAGAWNQPPRLAVSVPIAAAGGGRPKGFLAVGLNPHRPLDTAYLAFLRLLAGQLSSSLVGADAFEAQQERAAMLDDAMRLRQEASDALALVNTRLAALVEERTADLAAALARLTAESAERERVQDNLRQAQKMEVLGQLTGGIAHDFNNLLQGITGSLELLKRGLARGRTEASGRYVDEAMKAARRAAGLTHRLLAFSRRQPLDPKPVAVNPLVLSMEDLLHRTLGERIALTLDLAPDLWATRCDANQLESALLNLCINARDAMPDGGCLAIASCNVSRGAEPGGPDAHLAALQKGSPASSGAVGGSAGTALDRGDCVVISVTDTGVGMSADVMARAFDPFFTTKPIGQGTGLGLSMIFGFTRQSGGDTRIASVEGRGTTVQLSLPRFEGAVSEAEAPVGTVSNASAGAQRTVLVVEDEEVVRRLVVETLEDLGFQTLEAADGAAGLELLMGDTVVDLLVTDIGLPRLNGRQMVDAARLHRPRLKVLFMTGYAEVAVAAAEGFLEPGMEMITKPFGLEALNARLRSLLPPK